MLLHYRDVQDVRFTQLAQHLEKLDAIIDEHIQSHVLLTGRDGPAKLFESAQMETDIAEIGTWLGTYLRTNKPAHKERILDNIKDFRAELAQFTATTLSPVERRWSQEISSLFDKTMTLIDSVVVQHEASRGQIQRFLNLRQALDDVLDEGLQLLATHELRVASQKAERASSVVAQRLTVLIPLFFVGSLAVGALLRRAILRPLHLLTTGTAEVGAGHLAYRLPRYGSDEFADLAEQFNRMVAQLEATTVSKAQLEASEVELKIANVALRQEVAERQEAQAALRRNETLAAMGTLVSGVAHEVRNPLFGMSATLDAFEARFGDRDDYQKYLGLLRTGLSRLERLMRDLLAYGRPSSASLSPGPITAVLAQVRHSCTARAAQLGASIEWHLADQLPPILMDDHRLSQVFVNLIENALQHSPAGGTVVVTTAVVTTAEVQDGGDSWVQCAVTDSGPGFALEDLPHLFDPFFSRRHGGTGLGLAIVQRIVEEHEGQIVAGNRPEGGAVFTVLFPSSPHSATKAEAA